MKEYGAAQTKLAMVAAGVRHDHINMPLIRTHVAEGWDPATEGPELFQQVHAFLDALNQETEKLQSAV